MSKEDPFHHAAPSASNGRWRVWSQRREQLAAEAYGQLLFESMTVSPKLLRRNHIARLSRRLVPVLAVIRQSRCPHPPNSRLAFQLSDTL